MGRDWGCMWSVGGWGGISPIGYSSGSSLVCGILEFRVVQRW